MGFCMPHRITDISIRDKGADICVVFDNFSFELIIFICRYLDIQAWFCARQRSRLVYPPLLTLTKSRSLCYDKPVMGFEVTIGHKKQKELFSKVFQNGNLAHAYALIGPDNIGKTTFALELAQFLEADPIMDVLHFESEVGLTIKEVRELKNRLSLTPTGKLKIGIISHAERITLPAANALLKVLEEPPTRSAILLITSNLQTLIPTIASRVQKVFFRLSSTDEVNEALSKFSLEKENLMKIMNFAKGRIGLGIRFAKDHVFLEFQEKTMEFYRILKDH